MKECITVRCVPLHYFVPRVCAYVHVDMNLSMHACMTLRKTVAAFVMRLWLCIFLHTDFSMYSHMRAEYCQIFKIYFLSILFCNSWNRTRGSYEPNFPYILYQDTSEINLSNTNEIFSYLMLYFVWCYCQRGLSHDSITTIYIFNEILK